MEPLFDGVSVSSMDNEAAEIIVQHYPAVLFSAAFVLQKVEHGLSDLRCERLAEVFRLCYNAQQTLSIVAVWIEALSDVNVERVDELLTLQAHAPR